MVQKIRKFRGRNGAGTIDMQGVVPGDRVVDICRDDVIQVPLGSQKHLFASEITDLNKLEQTSTADLSSVVFVLLLS